MIYFVFEIIKNDSAFFIYKLGDKGEKNMAKRERVNGDQIKRKLKSSNFQIVDSKVPKGMD